MKLKVIAVLYTILMLACALVLWFRIEAKTEYQIDMLDLNTRADAVGAALSGGSDRNALEEEYGVGFSDEEVAELETVGDMMDAINEKGIELD